MIILVVIKLYAPIDKFKFYKYIKVKLSPSKKKFFFFVQFNGSSLKIMKNAFYFVLKALFVPEIFKILSRCFGPIFEKKAIVSFKIYEVADWTRNNYNTHVVQYLRK